VSPELRAAADSFIYDVAMLIHVANSLDEAALAKVSAATGWTLRQTLGHVAASYERYSGALSRRLAGEHAPWPNVPSSETAALERDTHVADVCGRLTAARASILASLEQVTPGQESAPLAEGFPPLGDVVERWSRHGSAHAVDFLETMPALGGDALILGWVLYPRAGEDAGLAARREPALAAVRKHFKEASR
jgi:hypothetical protein